MMMAPDGGTFGTRVQRDSLAHGNDVLSRDATAPGDGFRSARPGDAGVEGA